MDENNKKVVLAVVVVVAVALLATNFNNLTGSAVSGVDISVTPSIAAGGSVNVMVLANGNRVKNAFEIRKSGGTEVRTYQFDNCAGNWCNKPATGYDGNALLGTPNTSPTWQGGFYVLVREYQTNKELGRAYFTVT